MSALRLGQLAGLGTAFCWAFTSVFFTIGGRRVGAHIVNLMRLLIALLILLVLHRVTTGVWLPTDAEDWRWGWLLLSGLIGLTLGDASLFQAFVYLGPRLSALMMALVPIISSLLAWAWLGEGLKPSDMLAIPVTVAGVAWVVMERSSNSQVQPGKFVPGLLFAAGGALGQSVGLITSRLGLVDDFPALSATLIRITGAAGSLWLLPILTGQLVHTVNTFWSDPRARLTILAGTVVGPVTGVLLSLLAVQNAPIGIAATLMSLTPIVILPIVRLVFKERITPRTVAGTVVALVGVALIFLPDRGL